MAPLLMLDGSSLTLQDVLAVARQHRVVRLNADAREKMAASRAWVDRVADAGQPTVYGINTGLGVFATRTIPIDQSDRLSRNLIISHAIGIGEPFPEEVVRAAMLIRANTLAISHSGIRPETVQTLIDMLNAGVHPIIPSQSSPGASGDLAPLAHLALVLSRDPIDDALFSGEALYRGEHLPHDDGGGAARAADRGAWRAGDRAGIDGGDAGVGFAHARRCECAPGTGHGNRASDHPA
jgi:histidine ammonia-lyase